MPIWAVNVVLLFIMVVSMFRSGQPKASGTWTYLVSLTALSGAVHSFSGGIYVSGWHFMTFVVLGLVAWLFIKTSRNPPPTYVAAHIIMVAVVVVLWIWRSAG